MFPALQSTLRKLCRSILFDARIDSMRVQADGLFNEFEAMLGARTQKAVDQAEATVNLRYELTMVVFVCLAASFIGMLVIQQWNPILRHMQVCPRHAPHTPHPTLHTPHPTPHTPHPTPHTPHPTPHTPHPTPHTVLQRAPTNKPMG